MPLRPLRRIAALAILFLPQVLSGQGTSTAPTGTNLEQSAASTQPVNTTPKDCCGCVKIMLYDTVDQKRAGRPSEPIITADQNGDYPINFEVYTSCAEVEITSVSIRPFDPKMNRAGRPVKNFVKNTKLAELISGKDILDAGTNDWEIVVECKGSGGTSASGGSCTRKFTLGGCKCKPCEATGEPTVTSGSPACNIPLGSSNAGDTSGSLYFDSSEFSNPGPAGLFAFVPPSFTINSSNNVITSVVSPTTTLEVTPAPTTFDPNAFTITHKHTGTGTAFRLTTIAMVQEDGTWLRVDSTFSGSTFRHQQSKTHTNESDTYTLQSGPVTNGSFSVMRVETFVVTIPQLGTEIHRTSIQEEGVTVSDIETTWQNYAWGWEKTSETIDPANANLTSTWSYYQPGELTGPNASTEGYGRLHAHARHDGYQETHTYWLNNHQVIKPFANNAQGLTLSEQWNPSSNTLTTVQTVGGNTLSRETRKITKNGQARTIEETTFASNGSSLVSTTVLMPFGEDFGGQPASIAHPDGTTSTYAYATPRPNGGKTITVRNGILNGTTVTQGTATTTTYNAHGTPILGTTTLTGANNSITTDSYEVTAQDGFGRALTTSHFPGTANAYTTAATYNCCGLASSTDMHGVTTDYAYDGLHRQTQATTNGVTTATIYNGLTKTTTRNGLEVAKSVRKNLAGTSTTSKSPDPSSTADEVLTDTDTDTTFANGLTTKTITVGSNTLTTVTYPDGRAASITGTLQPNMTYSYNVNNIGLITNVSYLANELEVTITQTDWAGRTVSTQKGSITNTYAYYDNTAAVGSRGKLKSVTDADGVKTLYGYNAIGERVVTALKRNATATIDYGTDQITRTETVPATRTDSTEVLRTRTTVWQDGAGENDGTPVSYQDRTASGLDTWSWQIGAGETHTVSTIGLGRTATTTRPDGTSSVTTYADGFPYTTEHYASGGGDPITSSTYGRDGYNRPITVTDSRTGTTTTAYISATCDAVKSVTDPGGRTTSYTYDCRGNRTAVTHPDNSVTRTTYLPDGHIEATWGSLTYSVVYSYDYAGRMFTLRTQPTFVNDIPVNTGGSLTTWNYSPTTGLLQSKLDNSSNGPTYTYTSAGRLKTRTWARGDITRYDYDHGYRTFIRYFADTTLAAALSATSGNHATTPDVAITYDSLGRQHQVSNSLATSVFTYAADLGVDTETITYTLPNQDAFTRVLDRADRSLGRDMGFTLGIVADTDSEQTVSYGYSATTGLIEEISSGPDVFTYGYTYTQTAADPQADPPVPAGARVGATSGTSLKRDIMPYTITKTKSGSPTLRTTRTYEAARDVLASIQNKVDTTAVSVYDYSIVNGGVNNLGQRGGVRTTFNLGGPASNPGDTSWGYDSLGQLVSAATPVTDADRAYRYDTIGNRLFTENKAAQIPATPGLNSTAYTPDALNQYDSITPYDANGNAGTSVVPVFDDDGNMTNGPLPVSPGANCTLVWDAENRLIEAKANSTTTIERNYYDAKARRIATAAGGVTTLFIYDGFNCIAEYTREATGTPALSKTRLWGLDLSGSMQGAGGVGGLLAETHGADTFYPTFDGNGNVSEYLTGAGGVAAHFEYDPFGNTLVVSEASAGLAATFAYRFSTKPLDFLTGLYYYGYRYLDPLTGRWASRDPIEEQGGVNLYGFVGNDGVSKWDVLGLEKASCSVVQGPNKSRCLSWKTERFYIDGQVVVRTYCVRAVCYFRCRCRMDNCYCKDNKCEDHGMEYGPTYVLGSASDAGAASCVPPDKQCKSDGHCCN